MTQLSSPAAQRNRDPILDVLRLHLPPKGLAVEIASGSGEHVVHFAAHLPGLVFQPSDPDAAARASIDAWAADSGLANIKPALDLDVTRRPWPFLNAVAILCINMVHISRWAATEALIAGAVRHLVPGGVLYLYGPYKRDGAHTAPSNEAFDRSLRSRDPSWGVRDLETVIDLATTAGFAPPEITPMLANNLSLVFRRAG